MLSKFSVKKPYTVFVGVVLVIILGIVSFTRMTTDLLPNMSLPYVIVMTSYGGASPETVENEVTKTIESSMATVSNIKEVSSVSAENYSLVICEFEQSANMDSISLEIRENLDQLEGYWSDGVGSPIIMKLNPSMLPIMVAAVGVDGMDRAQVSEYVQNSVIPDIESIEGVASVSTTGLIDETVNVVITQEKVDKINEQIRAGIDAGMEEAEANLADAKAQLIEGEQALRDAQNETANAKTELEDGKSELVQKQDSTTTTMAGTMNQLNTAKADLEVAKTNYTTQIATISGYQKSITDAQNGLTAINAAIAGMEAMGDTTSQNYIDACAQRDMLNATITSLTKALDYATDGMGADMYLPTLNAALTQINTQITTVDNALFQLNKGNITAAIEFSNAATQIAMGEQQLAEAQEKIDTSLAEMQDAKDQLADGEEELADAKENAYAQADANEIFSVETLSALLTAQNFSYPAGYITEEGVSYLVRVGDKPSTPEEMATLTLMDMHIDGMDAITLEDVADVFYTDNSDEVYAKINGVNGVMLNIQKQTDYSTGDVSDKINAKFAELMKENGDLSLIPLMDQGIYIDLVMDSIFQNILFGAVLAILILLLFLKDIRPTMVIAISIPISLVFTIVCMYFSGVTLNIISLSGLALGIGMLVDNSIVVIENIYRLRNEGASITEAAVEGAKEVAGAIIASTLTTVCVFLPIVFTDGLTRQLFVDLGLTIAYSLLASLIVALTVVPAMASKTLVKTKEKKEGKFYTKVLDIYEKILRMCLKWKAVVFILSVVLLVVCTLASLSRGTAFMSNMESTQISATVTLPENTPLSETAKVTDEVLKRISTIDGIIDTGAMTASSGMGSLMGASDGTTNQTSVYITVEEDKELTNEEIANQIMELTADLDAEIVVETSSMDMSAMYGSGIEIVIKGRELDKLEEIAKDIAAIVEGVEGTTEVSDGMEDTTEEIRIVIDREKAMSYGLTVAQVYSQIATKLDDATQATTLAGEEKDYYVYVYNEQDSKMTKQDLEKMEIEGTDADNESVKVPISELAEFSESEGLSSINRENQSRYISVTASIADGYNIGLVSADMVEELEKYDMPSGYSYEIAGEDEAINDAISQVLLMLVLAIAFMYLIMVAQFQSLLSPFIIMFTIPLAFTGGFLGLYISGSEVSVIALIGFVMLAGIIVNNGIVIVDYMNQLRAGGMERREAIVTAGRTRLRPVLMTASTTILALSTMVFSTDMGAEMSKPMAIVTIGGLVYGTLLTLIVVPCIYDVFMRGKKKKIGALEVEAREVEITSESQEEE